MYAVYTGPGKAISCRTRATTIRIERVTGDVGEAGEIRDRAGGTAPTTRRLWRGSDASNASVPRARSWSEGRAKETPPVLDVQKDQPVPDSSGGHRPELYGRPGSEIKL